MVNFKNIQEHVSNIARKYSAGISMSAEDLEQELWIEFFTKNNNNCYANEAIAVTALKNKAIDIYRSLKLTDSKAFSYDFQASVADVMEADANEAEFKMGSTGEAEYRDIETTELLTRVLRKFREQENLSKREAARKQRGLEYIICKAYLDCNIKMFEDECISILAREIPTKLELANFLSNPNCGSDDMILKTVLHIQTGTNSGSVRAMKWSDDFQTLKFELKASLF